MCISPNMLADGTLIGCRNCWQCSERKILDWTGRCIAESRTSTATHSITLTYGRASLDPMKREWVPDKDGQESHPQMTVLTYSDVQKYFKRLRKAGFPCSYFVTGEYGSDKGRAHWHAVIFWHGPVPKHKLDTKKYEQEHWPHGFSYWRACHAASVRYACKYVQKDLNDAEAQGHLSMSKKPPLGARWFAKRAQTYVASGLSPQTLAYTFHDAVDKNGKKLKFLLQGRSGELFLEEYIRRFRGFPERGFQGPPCPVRGWHYPPSKLVEEYEDKWWRDYPLTAEQVDAIILSKPRKVSKWQEAIVTDPDAPTDPALFAKWSARAKAYLGRTPHGSEEI